MLDDDNEDDDDAADADDDDITSKSCSFNANIALTAKKSST